MERVGRQEIERPRHLQKSERRHRQTAADDLPAEAVDDRPLGLGRLGRAGRVQGKGVAKPIHVFATEIATGRGDCIPRKRSRHKMVVNPRPAALN